MFAPIEGLTGILMCGLSAGLFVALANRIFALRGPGDLNLLTRSTWTA
jgi:hypothetical protein